MVRKDSRVIRRAWGVLVAAVIGAAWHVTASGQGALTITFPNRIAAGPDYATDVLRDAWDMSNVEDVSPDPGEIAGFSNFSVSNGVAGGTTAIADAGVVFLTRGINGSVTAHKNGISFPIDTASYQKLSLRLSDSGPGESPQAYWFPKQSGEVSPEQFGVKILPPTKTGNSILVSSLTTGSGGNAWTSAPMIGFRIDPNSNNAGNQMFFDWIRLTCADNSPCATMNTISWSGGSGSATVDVIDAGGTVLNIATGVTGTSVSWNSGILPPGAYTLRVARTNGSSSTKAFTINTPPTIAVTDPSRTTGADFATTVLGNPWDMSASNDIVGASNISPITFSNGQLHGTNTSGDAALELLNGVNNAGGARAIDTSRYRYLTYRLQVDGPVDIANGSVTRVFWSSGPNSAGGDVTTTRDIVAFAGMRTYTVDLASLSVGVKGGLEDSGTREPWTTNNKRYLRFDPHEFATVRNFHIDDVKLTAIPEASGAYTIRWAGADADGDAATVNLYYDTDRNPVNGKTTIVTGVPIAQGSFVWNSSAAPAGTYYIHAEAFDGVNVSTIYSDSPIVRGAAGCTFTISPASAAVPHAGGAGTVGVTASASTCNWSAASNSSFITVTGGAAGTGNGTVSYGVAPNPGRLARGGTITIAGQVFTINQAGAATAGDFTGDGVADYTAYNRPNGLWRTSGQAAVQLGLPGDIPVPGDYTGDRIVDRAVFRPSDGGWYIQGAVPFQWGLVGDLPVPADYDGDGVTDAAVFRRVNGSGGTWFIRNQPARSFGLHFDEPVPADYDGDGRADLAVFRPTTGAWYIALSSTGFASVSVVQWGLPGDVPVPGDFDGDHRADLTVYRPSAGIWYVLYSASNYSTSSALHWGVLGDVPVAADFSGDGIDDPTVFRASDATFWTYNLVTAVGTSLQQGTPGDVAAFQRPRRLVVPRSDFDGDLRSDVSVYRPSNGTWFIRHSSSDYATTQSIQWGLSGDKAVPGDYDGDQRTDVAVWRPSNGTWYLKYSIGGFTRTAAVQWGLQGDIPVPADYDGDGRTDPAVFRPSSGNWFVLRSSAGYSTAFTQQLGLSGDVPVQADYDGDGKADVAVFRPASGQWFISRSTLGSYVRQFGLSSDVPIAGDFDRDGRADLTLFRPSAGQWLGIDPLTSNSTMNRQWGLNGDTPVAHDFDGDGAADTAVFRPPTAEWFIVFSSAPNGPTKKVQWGLGNSDLPQ